ncbi:hypothetical protein [Nocardia africana]
MPYFYKYLGDDQDLVVESEDPRPDLLEWAYWTEIDAPAPKFNEGGIVPPAPVAVVNDSPEPERIIEPAPAKKAAPRKPRTPKDAE